MNNFKGFTNDKCEFYPCHTINRKDFNCLFCYCPLLAYECPGPYEVFTDKHGNLRKDCTNCALPHDGIQQSWNFIQIWLSNPILWSKQKQSPEAIKLYKKHIQQYFNPEDIKWAENTLK